MIKRLNPGERYSAAVIHNGVVYLSGVVANDETADIKGQAADIFAQIDATLAQAGTSKSRLLAVNIWLADIADFDAMNSVYDNWIDPQNMPVRATVESKLAGPEYLIEVQVKAAV